MDPEIIDRARARVSSALGERLASNLTDAFCLAFGQPASSFATVESINAGTVAPSVVLEFTAQPEVSAEVNRAVDELRRSKAWSSLRSLA